jgi:hypothetical protein
MNASGWPPRTAPRHAARSDREGRAGHATRTAPPGTALRAKGGHSAAVTRPQRPRSIERDEGRGNGERKGRGSPWADGDERHGLDAATGERRGRTLVRWFRWQTPNARRGWRGEDWATVLGASGVLAIGEMKEGRGEEVQTLGKESVGTDVGDS